MTTDIDELLDKVANNLESLSNKTVLTEDPNFLSIKKTNSDSSQILPNLSDSSDDEEFREHITKYNSYGKQIKSMLKCAQDSPGTVPKHTLSVPSKPSSLPKSSNTFGYIDPTLGLRIVNPLIAHNDLISLMQGKEVVHLGNLKKFTKNASETSKDWIVGGILVGKLTKTSQKGNQFTVWTLSDLKGDFKTFSVFLFRSACKELWKISLGTVVSILNPNVFEKRENSKDEACLSVDNVQKVLILGQSKDYGICKSIKKDGSACSNFVNLSICEYCSYHVKLEYQKCSSKRSDLQSSFSRMQQLRSTILGTPLGQYKKAAIVKNKELQAKDNMRLQSLIETPLVAAKVSPSLRNKDQELLKKLGQSTKRGLTAEDLQDGSNLKQSSSVTLESSKESALSVISQLKSKKNDSKIEKTVKNKCETNENAKSDVRTNLGPILSNKNDTVDLSTTFSLKTKTRAKLNALKWVEKHGPIAKSDPNSISANRKRKRPISIPNTENKEENTLTENFSDRYKKIMAAQSNHASALDDLDDEKMHRYLDVLEKKERMEEKMVNTFKVACKSVTCLQCKYTSFSAAERCKTERHRLKVKDAIKRFFQCAQCQNRTVTLDVYPTKGCGKCDGFKWERAGMMKEKIVRGREGTLSIRGGEQTFVNSHHSDANINLLVPPSE